LRKRILKEVRRCTTGWTKRGGRDQVKEFKRQMLAMNKNWDGDMMTLRRPEISFKNVIRMQMEKDIVGFNPRFTGRVSLAIRGC